MQRRETLVPDARYDAIIVKELWEIPSARATQFALAGRLVEPLGGVIRAITFTTDGDGGLVRQALESARQPESGSTRWTYGAAADR